MKHAKYLYGFEKFRFRFDPKDSSRSKTGSSNERYVKSLALVVD